MQPCLINARNYRIRTQYLLLNLRTMRTAVVAQPGHEGMLRLDWELDHPPEVYIHVALNPNSLVPDCCWDNESAETRSTPVRRMREIACRVRVSV